MTRRLMRFEMDIDRSGWTGMPAPSKPRFHGCRPGAVDAHCHVFGPGANFPYAPERKYTPCDASKAAAVCAARFSWASSAMSIVQATCHGADNRALVDALRARRGGARGRDGAAGCRRRDLRALDAAACAACGSISSSAWSNFTPKDVLLEIARRHCPARLARRRSTSRPRNCRSSMISSLRCRRTVVVDHMGRPDVTKPVDGPEFELFDPPDARASERLVEGQLSGAALEVPEPPGI